MRNDARKTGDAQMRRLRAGTSTPTQARLTTAEDPCLKKL